MADLDKVIKGLDICTTRPCSCFGCPYEKDCTLDSQELMEDALALLKKQRWIPVSERLPDVGQSVLVYAVGKIDGFIGEHVTEICKRFVMRFLPSSPGHEVWSSPYQFFHTDYEITHWMPLPEMPKEDNDND